MLKKVELNKLLELVLLKSTARIGTGMNVEMRAAYNISSWSIAMSMPRVMKTCLESTQ